MLRNAHVPTWFVAVLAAGIAAGGVAGPLAAADEPSGTANRHARRALEHGFQAVLAKPLAPGALDDLLVGWATS